MGKHVIIKRLFICLMAVFMTAMLLAGSAAASDIDDEYYDGEEEYAEEYAEDYEEEYVEENAEDYAEEPDGKLVMGADPNLVSHAESIDGYTLIYTYEDMEKIRENPQGTYKLMNDIDFSGKKWEPLDFQGTFDGSGFAILNCIVESVTKDTRTTYDGNMIDYDTVFAGFFGIVEDAEIRDLSLYGLNVNIDVKGDCFAGGMAGYTDSSVIQNCTINGTVSLFVDGRQIGVGGAVGFGNGEILNCTIDTTLICVDMNVEEKDEQFMGGVNANGYMSMDSCIVKIRGYDSDHGYVHDGGLSGMFIVYPEGNEYFGFITNNSVEGFITFFEDNEDRRAYCERGIGEDMSETYEAYGNEYDFEADERFEYDTTLLPHSCVDPTFQKDEVSQVCPDYGYTVYTCDECGYSYNADYKPAVHTPIEFSVVVEASENEPGLRRGRCALCGLDIFELTEFVPEETTDNTVATETESIAGTEAETAEPTTAAPVRYTGTNVTARIIVIVLLALLAIIVIVIIVLLIMKKRQKARIRQMKIERRKARKQLK